MKPLSDESNLNLKLFLFGLFSMLIFMFVAVGFSTNHTNTPSQNYLGFDPELVDIVA